MNICTLSSLRIKANKICVQKFIFFMLLAFIVRKIDVWDLDGSKKVCEKYVFINQKKRNFSK